MARKRFASIPPRRAFALALTVGLCVLAACGPAPEPPTPALPAPAAAPVPPVADASFGLLFSRIAGLPAPAASVPASRPAEPFWTAYADLAGKEWAGFHQGVLEPMRTWADRELKEARQDTTTLFYPFGGPDFVTSDALFPNVTETVLMGLEPVGNLPDFDKVPAKWREGFFADLGELASGFLKRGYFITSEMNDIYGRGRVDGALSVVAFFLAREGYDIAEVKRLLPTETGAWTETPYERLTRRPRRPYGVKIVYFKPGETFTRNVYYFSCDVEDKAFRPDSPLYRLFAGLGRLTTFVKSGSYLLHWGNFATLRRFILDRSLYVLQDDTAVPYRYFIDGGWDVHLYGRYTQPVADFTNVEQEDLRRAYEDPEAGVTALPFHFGYHWRSQVDNLLLAKRPRRAYKVPVAK